MARMMDKMSVVNVFGMTAVDVAEEIDMSIWQSSAPSSFAWDTTFKPIGLYQTE
jgi:hypothetical protein